MSALANKTHVLAANVADGANFTTTYPSGVTQADLVGSLGAVIFNKSTQAVHRQGAGGFTLAFGASNITVTNDSDTTWLSGAELVLSFGDRTNAGSYNQDLRVGGVVPLTMSVGTASDTIPDVGGSFNQTTLNNALASLGAKINAVAEMARKAAETNG